MRPDRLARSAYFGFLSACVACGGDRDGDGAARDVPALEPPTEIASPAAAGSGMPFLSTGPDGVVRMSWIEPAGAGHALRFAVLQQSGWSASRTIATGANWFVNWADFPSLVPMPDGSLAAHWLQREGADTYAYGVRIVTSRDGGQSWSEPVTPHRDGTLTEHGFVSLFPADGEHVAAVWLDGRNMAAGTDDSVGLGADMTLRGTTIGPDGTVGPELLIDDRTCECCQTDVAIAADGPVLVYRNRSPDEVRDIGITTSRNGRWSAPRIVHDDGWKLLACPVNGPAVAAQGNRVAVAWFTAASDAPRVLLAFSPDGGDSFDPPIRIDDGEPEGRVDLLLLPGGDAVVTWLERSEPATIRTRRVTPAGIPGPSTIIAETSAARASGFPRLAEADTAIVFAWTSPGEEGGVRTAVSRFRR